MVKKTAFLFVIIFIFAIFFISFASAGILINSPLNNTEILNSLSTTLNTSQTAYNNTIWYSWTNGIKNYTLCTNSNECQATITFPRQGYYNLSVYGNKSDGTITSQNVSNLFVGNQTTFQNVTYWNSTSGNFGNLFDNNWSSYVAVGSNTKANVTLAYILSNINVIKANWTVSDFAGSHSPLGIFNLSVNINCLNNTNMTFRIRTPIDIFDSGASSHWQWECYNNVNKNYTVLRDIGFDSLNIENNRLYEEQLIVTSYSQNIAPTITNTLSNNTNFTTSLVNFTYNISDDNDYLTNISLILDGIINKTSLNVPITANANNSLNFSVANIPDGTHSWYIQAYDSDGIQANSSIFQIRVDTTPPSISIIYPTSDYYSFDHPNNLNINFTRIDSGIGIDTCWWSNSSGSSNQTLSTGQNISVTETGDGTYRVDIWCNDTLNNIGTNHRYYVVNTVSPVIHLYTPFVNTWLNYKNNIQFNFSVLDAHTIDTCELWGNWTGIWQKNQSKTGILNDDTITSFNLLNLTDGTYLWNVWCNESNGIGNWRATNWTFSIDTIFPQINLTYPLNTTYTYLPNNLNYTRSDLNINSCWSNNGSVNSTSDPTCSNFTLTSNQGSNTWTVWINDSANNQNYSSVTFFVDSIIPVISINTFSNGSYLNYNSSISINVTESDTNLQSCYWNENNGINNSFVCGNNLSLNLSDESLHTINIYSNDTLGNIGNNSISFYTDTKYPQVNITSINPVTGSQTFTFDVSATNTYLNTCKYSIYKSDGTIDGLYNNLSLSCVSVGNSATVSAFGTYNLTLCAITKASNENCTTNSFTTANNPPLSIGGGGSTGQENKIPVIGLIFENSTYSDLEKEIAYARINDYCYKKTNPTAFALVDYSEECNLKSSDLISIKSTLNETTISINDLSLFYSNYKKKLIFQGFETQTNVNQYNLFTSVLGILNALILDKPSIAHPVVLYSRTSYNISEKILANKQLSSDCLIVDDNPDVICSVDNNTIRISYKVTNPQFFSKRLSTIVSVSTNVDDPAKLEQKKIPISFTVYNIAYLNWALVLIGFVSIVGVSLLFARFKNKKKSSFKKFEEFIKI